jgi:Dynamin family
MQEPLDHLRVQFDQHQLWCVAYAKRLTALAEWLQNNNLADANAYAEVNRLRYLLSSQQVMVAVVAEFSRGKSELINALFFAHYGQRIMPAGAGRTTMCPAELAWNPALPTGIRLLPIETRKEASSIAHWRVRPESWVQFGFDPKQPQSMAQTINKVSDVQRVSIQEATALGFWLADLPDGSKNPDNPVPDREGRIEVPVWRHACINIPHPLLAQGLVILDTPGLNAVGVEPELTMALLGQAQATLFILGADTGVTKSDLDLWRQHLSHAAAAHIPRYAILNKIDTLWDELKTEGEIHTELEKQCFDTAQLLSINRQSVVAVSAQKGLVAKIQHNPELLVRSGLPALEAILGGHLVRQRQTIIQQNCMSGLTRLQSAAARTLERRFRAIAEQKAELQSVSSKSSQNLKNMLGRIALEKQEVEQSAADFQHLHDLCGAGLTKALTHIGTAHLKAQIEQLGQVFDGSLLKVGLRESYEATFARLSHSVQSCDSELLRLFGELSTKIKTINTLHGYAIALTPVPNLTPFADKLLNIRLSHLHHLEFGSSWRLMNKAHLQRLLQTLYLQVRVIFETAQADIEQWLQTTVQTLHTELSERQQSLAKRSEAVGKVGDSSQTLGARIAHLDQELETIRLQGRRLVAISKGLEGEVDSKLQQGLGLGAF